MPTNIGYTGQRLDSTGLMYYRARYYAQGLGRFVSADTMVPEPSNPQSLNRFSYTRNNPLKYIDPSGHRETDGCDTEGCSATQWDIDRAIGNAERAESTKFYRDCANGGGPECNTLHDTENILKGMGLAFGGMVAAPFAAAHTTTASAIYGTASYTVGNGAVNTAQGKGFFEGWSPVDAALAAGGSAIGSKLGLGPTGIGVVSGVQSATSQVVQGKSLLQPEFWGQVGLNALLGSSSAKIGGGIQSLESALPQAAFGQYRR